MPSPPTRFAAAAAALILTTLMLVQTVSVPAVADFAALGFPTLPVLV